MFSLKAAYLAFLKKHVGVLGVSFLYTRQWNSGLGFGFVLFFPQSQNIENSLHTESFKIFRLA